MDEKHLELAIQSEGCHLLSDQCQNLHVFAEIVLFRSDALLNPLHSPELEPSD